MLYVTGILPLAIAALMFAVAFLYWAAPNVDLPFKWVSPGAIFFRTRAKLIAVGSKN